jgi:hypothetical protein
MTLNKIGYAVMIAVAAAVIAIGTAGTSEAKGKKKMAAPPPMPPTCWFTLRSPVCATKGGMKSTYFNACYADKDGAKVSSSGECRPAKMAKKSMKKMKKKM